MITVTRTDSNNPNFINSERLLDKYLAEVFGMKQEYYNQFNIINDSATVAVAYENEMPAGCGCLRRFDIDSVEIKRMFVSNEHRNKGNCNSRFT